MNKKTKEWCIENMLNTVHCQELLDYLGYGNEDDENTLTNLKLKDAEYNSIKIRVRQSINIIQALDINEVSKQGAISALKLVLNEFYDDKSIFNTFVLCDHCNTNKKCRSKKSCYLQFKNKNEH